MNKIHIRWYIYALNGSFRATCAKHAYINQARVSVGRKAKRTNKNRVVYTTSSPPPSSSGSAVEVRLSPRKQKNIRQFQT